MNGGERMYYVLISMGALLFSMQFMFNDGYQKENGDGWNSTIKLTFYTSVIGFIITLFVNKFNFEFSVFSLILAIVYGIVCIALNYCTIKSFEYASLSVYTVFSMIGGMALPFIYGLMFGEKLNITKIVCFLLIVFSIILMADKGKNSKRAFPYYIGVFLLNGLVGVISAYHQSKVDVCVDSGSFLMLVKIVMSVFAFIVMINTKDFRINKKSYLYCTGISTFNSIGNLLLLIALLNLPASVQYPMVTGGTIVFSTIIDLLRKVNVKKREMIAAIIACGSACLMAL